MYGRVWVFTDPMPLSFLQAIITPSPHLRFTTSPFPALPLPPSDINLLFLLEHLYPRPVPGFSSLMLFQAWRGPVGQAAPPLFHLQQMPPPGCGTGSGGDRAHHTTSSNTGTSPLPPKPGIFSLPCCLANSQQAVLRHQVCSIQKTC